MGCTLRKRSSITGNHYTAQWSVCGNLAPRMTSASKSALPTLLIDPMQCFLKSSFKGDARR
jgi:hypothetical protein